MSGLRDGSTSPTSFGASGEAACTRGAVNSEIRERLICRGCLSELRVNKSQFISSRGKKNRRRRRRKAWYFLCACFQEILYQKTLPFHPSLPRTPHRLGRLNRSAKMLHKLSALICAGAAPQSRSGVIAFTAKWLSERRGALDPVQRQTADQVAVMLRPLPPRQAAGGRRRAHFFPGLPLPPQAARPICARLASEIPF